MRVEGKRGERGGVESEGGGEERGDTVQKFNIICNMPVVHSCG